MGWRPRKLPSRRVTRWVGFWIVTVGGSLVGVLVAIPFLVRGMVRALELMVSGSVWLATSVGSGADTWTIVGTIGRAVGLALVTPKALGVSGALLLVGAAALAGLRQLLDSEERAAAHDPNREESRQ